MFFCCLQQLIAAAAAVGGCFSLMTFGCHLVSGAGVSSWTTNWTVRRLRRRRRRRFFECADDCYWMLVVWSLSRCRLG